MGLPARAFVTLLRLAPSGIQNRMWKWWYQKMANANDDREFRFMNYGFEDGKGPELKVEDEPNRMFIQLYSMNISCLLYTSPSPRDQRGSRMPSSA